MFGYTWVVALHVLGKLSFKTTLLLANVSSVSWLAVYFLMLEAPEKKHSAARASVKPDRGSSSLHSGVQAGEPIPDTVPEGQDHPLLEVKGIHQSSTEPHKFSKQSICLLLATLTPSASCVKGFWERQVVASRRFQAVLHSIEVRRNFFAGSDLEEEKPEALQMMNRSMQMELKERLQRTLTLWPYIVPLVLVYFAEYSMQVG